MNESCVSHGETLLEFCIDGSKVKDEFNTNLSYVEEEKLK